MACAFRKKIKEILLSLLLPSMAWLFGRKKNAFTYVCAYMMIADRYDLFCLLLSALSLFRRTTLSPSSSIGKSTRAETCRRTRVPFIGLCACAPGPPLHNLLPCPADNSPWLIRRCVHGVQCPRPSHYAQCTVRCPLRPTFRAHSRRRWRRS